MNVQTASVTIVTDNLIKTCEFYTTHFGAHIVFDCGWYLALRLGSEEKAPSINIMSPQEGAPPLSGGLFINLEVDNADSWFKHFEQAGVEPAMPLEDHPWGDRGFAVKDPTGSTVYCYHSIAPAEDFKQYFHQ